MTFSDLLAMGALVFERWWFGVNPPALERRVSLLSFCGLEIAFLEFLFVTVHLKWTVLLLQYLLITLLLLFIPASISIHSHLHSSNHHISSPNPILSSVPTISDLAPQTKTTITWILVG